MRVRGGNRVNFTDANDDEKTICRGGSYAQRFGMFENRYNNLMECLRLREPKSDGLNKDPWWKIRHFINTFNSNMREVFSPSDHLLSDDIISAWKELCQIYTHWGMYLNYKSMNELFE